MTAVTFSPDGRMLISGARSLSSDDTQNGALQLLSADNGELVHELNPITNQVTGLAFAPDGRYFVSTTLDGVVRLWGIP
jgi:WD40 repeat protein